MGKLARYYLLALCLILPVKFGIAVNNSEITFFPLSLLEWVLTPWPPFLLPVLAGLGLLLASVEGGRHGSLSRSQVTVLIAFEVLVYACLVGLVKTSEWDYALLFLWHLLGVLALGLAMILQANLDSGFRRRALAAVAVGALLASLSGWEQVKGRGYENTLAYIRQLQAEGLDVAPEVVARLERGRASGPFVYPNSFAAHLLLTAPLTIVLAWRLGGCFKPEKFSRPLIAGTCLVVAGGAFLFTQSRAAIVAAVGGAVATVAVAFLRKSRGRTAGVAIAGAALLLGVGAMLAVNRGRTLASLDARGDYYRAGLEMFVQHPLTGVGMGEFFPWYMRLKPPATEETRIPHSVAMLFMSQCGLFGGFAVGFWLLASLASLRPKKTGTAAGSATEWAVFGGGFAWLTHSLVDFNFQIPGTVATFAVLACLSALPPPAGEAENQRQASSPPTLLRGLALKIAAVFLAVVCFAGLWRLPGEIAYQRFYTSAQVPTTPWPMAVELAQDARRKLPFSPYADIVLAKRADAENRYAEAAEALDRAVRRTPHRGGLWYMLADTRATLGDPDGARDAYQKAIVWYPNHPRRMVDN